MHIAQLQQVRNRFDDWLSVVKEKLEDTKGVIRIRKLKEKQHNGKKKKKGQTQKNKDRANGDEPN